SCGAPSAASGCTGESSRRERGYTASRRPGDRGRAVRRGRGKSGHRRAGRPGRGGGESRRKGAQKPDGRRGISGGSAGRGEKVGEEPTSAVATRRLAKPRPVQGEQAPTTLPAEEPGRPHRWMVARDRIRLTGLLRKSPAQSGLFYAPAT